MGLEVACRADWASQSGEGRAQLETDALRFKGAFRLAIPLRNIKKAVARDGALEVTFGREKAVFHIGAAAAARWADKILHPPSVLDKLGVKPDMRVAIAGTADEALLAEIRTRTPHVVTGRARAGTAIAFLFAHCTADLARLRTLRAAVFPDGAVWVVWPKGRPGLKEDHVRAAARGLDLVDVKVASVSESLSGLKLMVPSSSRSARRS